MDKKGLILIGMGILLASGLLLYYFFFQKNEYADDPIDPISNITVEDFSLKYEYKGESRWEYTVVGQLPNPCFKVTTESLVAESYPEQVSIVVKVKDPDPDEMCIQVIQEYEYMGEFNASELAKISLKVVEE